ncbi:hypothetical protein D3C80_797420 [compost metagenome]
MGLQGLFGLHVHVWPVDVVGTGFHQGQVEWTVLFADAFEAVEVAAVAAEEEACVAVDHHPRGPEGAVAVEQATAGKVLRRGSDELDAIDFRALPPIQLADFARVDAPLDQGVAYAQRGKEVFGLVRELEHGLMIQVIVVVVGQDHRFDRWQFFQADRWLVETLGAGPLYGRGTLGEDRVGDPEFVAQLEQHRGVAQAIDAVVGRCDQRGLSQGLHRDGRARASVLRFVEQHVP